MTTNIEQWPEETCFCDELLINIHRQVGACDLFMHLQASEHSSGHWRLHWTHTMILQVEAIFDTLMIIPKFTYHEKKVTYWEKIV